MYDHTIYGTTSDKEGYRYGILQRMTAVPNDPNTEKTNEFFPRKETLKVEA